MVSIKPQVLSLTKQAFALAAPPDGTILSGPLLPVMGARHWPLDLGPVRAQLAAVGKDSLPIALALVLEDNDPDVDITGTVVAEQLAGVATVRGVAVVSEAEVLELLAASSPEIKKINGIINIKTSECMQKIISVINDLVGGEFSGEQAAEAWATALLVTGMGKKFMSTKMLELLRHGPPAGTPGSTLDASPATTDSVHTPVRSPAPVATESQPRPRPLAPVTPSATTLDEMKPSTMLTVDDIVRLFSVSRSFAYELKGHVPSFNFGGLRFRKGDIEDYLRSRERRPTRLVHRPPRRSGTPVASAGSDDEEVLPGLTRRELKKKAGF